MNLWNIPDSLEDEVRARDKKCVYCGVEMLQKLPRGTPRKAVATWEHIINDARIVTRENIALCCCGCNASKGQKTLVDWLQSAYCTQRRISEDTVAQIVRDALAVARSAPNQTMERTPKAFASRLADRYAFHFRDDFHTFTAMDARSRPPSLILFSLGLMRTLYLILFVVAGLAFAQQPPSPRPLTTAEAAALVEPVALGHRVLAALSHYFEVKIPRGPAGTGPTLLTSMPTLELLHVAACLNDSDFALSRHYRATLHTMLPNAPATQPVLSMRTDRGELFFDIGGNRTLQPSE